VVDDVQQRIEAFLHREMERVMRGAERTFGAITACYPDAAIATLLYDRFTAQPDPRDYFLMVGEVTGHKNPEFALMLMNIMNNRLRLTIDLMKQTASLPAFGDRDELRVFDKKMMEELVGAFDARPPQIFPAGRTIMREGDAGTAMYIVMRGRVVVSIKSFVVDTVGPGGTFGEMALVDGAARSATAVANTECQLLMINRADFLTLVKTKPGFAISLLKTIADRLRAMTAQKK
jgi:CRP-like cAMP-binding protein